MHQHQVYDTDNHFVIDPITKEIINQSEKMKLMLGDHNSERFTFEIPRYIDGHDMTLCDKIEIHYINIDSKTKESNKDVYIVDDMQLSPNGEDVVIFSWLISGNATQLAGTLNFRATFKCISEPSIIDYQMSTEIFKGITVSDGISNSESVVEEYSDVLEQWKQELNLTGEYAQQIEQNASEIDELIEKVEANAKLTDDAIAELKGDFVEYSSFEQIHIIESGYIANAIDTVDINTIVESNAWHHAIIQCTYGDVFTFSGESGDTPRLWAFIKNDGTIIANEFANTTADGKVIHAPKDTAYLILNKRVTDASICYKGSKKDDCREYDNMPYDIKLKEDYRLDADGIMEYYKNFFCSDFISVQPGDAVLITGYFGKSDTNTTPIFGYSASSEEFKATPIYSIDGLCYVDRAKVTIPCSSNIKFVRVCGRKYNSSIPDVRVCRAAKNSCSKPKRRDLNNIKFNHAENYCIEYPTECGQIGLMSVLDIRKIPVHNKINDANLYMWAAPHDGLDSSAWGNTENTSNAGSIYLWYSDKPDGEWKLYSDTPVVSRAEFARQVTNNPANEQYIPSDNGGIIHILHVSSPDVVWDETLELTRDGKKYKGGFRIFFHATGWKTASAPDTSPAVVQYTYYATSVDGLRVDSWNATSLDSPTIWINGEDDIDALSSDYARFFRQGNAWYAIYNAEPLGGTYNIAIAKSINNGKTFRYKRYLLKANAYYKMVRAGIPGVLMYDDCIYIAYTAVDSSIYTESSGTYGDGIYLARITDDGTVYDCGQILKEKQDASDDEWDSYRICAPYLLEYDGHIYMYYGGASKKDAISYATRWRHSHIGVSKEA